MLNTSSGRHFTLPNNNVIYTSIVICHFKKKSYSRNLRNFLFFRKYTAPYILL